MPSRNKLLPEPILNMFYGKGHFNTPIMANDAVAPCVARSSAVVTLNVYHWQIHLLSIYIICLYLNAKYKCTFLPYHIITFNIFPLNFTFLSCVSKGTFKLLHIRIYFVILSILSTDFSSTISAFWYYDFINNHHIHHHWFFLAFRSYFAFFMM